MAVSGWPLRVCTFGLNPADSDPSVSAVPRAGSRPVQKVGSSELQLVLSRDTRTFPERTETSQPLLRHTHLYTQPQGLAGVLGEGVQKQACSQHMLSGEETPFGKSLTSTQRCLSVLDVGLLG